MKTYCWINRLTTLFAIIIGTALPMVAVPLELVSTNDPSVSPPAAGGGDSSDPIISRDGRYVLFASRANNLTSISNNTPYLSLFPPKLNVFLRDRTAGTTTLVSVNLAGTGGGNGDSLPTGLSTNGQYALFQSSASDLVANDTNNYEDVFVRDLVHGTTLLVSAKTNGSSLYFYDPPDASMTAEGRFVAFTGTGGLLVRDLLTGAMTQITPGVLGSLLPPLLFNSNSVGRAEMPEITPDGRSVAFLCYFFDFQRGRFKEVCVSDLVTGNTVLVSSNLLATGALLNTYNHVISDDGQFVVFEASSNAAYATGTIFRYNLQTGAIDTVCTNAVAAKWPYTSYPTLDMTPDGRYITFVAYTNTGPGTTTGVFIWDAQTGNTALVSVDRNGAVPTNSDSRLPSIDASGRFVAFLSTATNLTTNVVAGDFHLYVRDLQAGSTRLVDADTNGIGAAKTFVSAPCLTPDGRFVAFDCSDSALVPNDNNHAYDVFLRDLQAPANELISIRDPALASQTPGRASYSPSISTSCDGRYIAFASCSDSLVANYTNKYRGVFVRDLLSGTNILVSVDTNGLAGADGSSGDPLISDDGSYVIFTSLADNFVAGDDNGAQDIFIRDLATGTTSLVSVNTNGSGPGDAGSYSPVISADGQSVLFSSTARNLAPGSYASGSANFFWRNLRSGTTYAVTTSGSVGSAAMTPDGRFVGFGTYFIEFGYRALGPCVWDSQSATIVFSNNIYHNSWDWIQSVAISPDGNRLVAQAGNTLYASDRTAHANWTIVPDYAPRLLLHAQPQFSGDARWLVYVTQIGQVAEDTNALLDVYLYDFHTRSNLLVSRSADASVAANGPSDSPVISNDGRFIAYRSFATNIVPGVNPGHSDAFLYDRQTGQSTLLAVSAFGGGRANYRSFSPVFSGDGQTLVFQSWASDLILRDFNQGADLFALRIAATNPAPVFAGQIVFVPTSGEGPTLTWPAQVGKTYQVQYKDNLGDAVWQPLTGNVWVAGSQGYATDLAPNPVKRFYCVVGL